MPHNLHFIPHSSPADKKNYCDRVGQSMKLGMQVRFGIYSSIRKGAKKKSLFKKKSLSVKFRLTVNYVKELNINCLL